MKKFKDAFFMALSMYSAIPCPYRPWNEQARSLMLVFLPVVGAIFGCIWYVVAYLLVYAGAPKLIMAVVLTLCPWALSGFLHLDGFMDCCDAVLSRRSLEERRRILKDSHTGAFAVICIVILALICFAIFASMPENTNYVSLIFVPISARCVAALGVELIKPLPSSQFSGDFKNMQKHSHVLTLAVMLVLAVWLPQFFSFKAMAAPIGAALGTMCALAYAARDLGGMSGDISGYSITIGEAVGAAALMLIYLI